MDEVVLDSVSWKNFTDCMEYTKKKCLKTDVVVVQN